MQLGSPIVLLPVRTAHGLVVDLIGDLDAQLAHSLSEALQRLGRADEGVVVRLKHLSLLQPSGLAALASVIADQTRNGRNVRVASESSRVKAFMRTARVAVEAGEGDSSACHRHVMIVHNGNPARDCA